jgi:hypothetical protein
MQVYTVALGSSVRHELAFRALADGDKMELLSSCMHLLLLAAADTLQNVIAIGSLLYNNNNNNELNCCL